MVSLSTCATIYVLNIHHRSPKSHHKMPKIIRKIFLEFLAKFLFKNTIDESGLWIKSDLKYDRKQCKNNEKHYLINEGY